MKNFLLFLLSFIFISVNLFAENVSIDPKLKGVWRGTIGKQEVMVCFGGYPSGFSYYYIDHLDKTGYLETISLGFFNENILQETNRKGRWYLKSITNDYIDGLWSANLGLRNFPFHLEQILNTNGQPILECNDEAYIAPLLKKQKTITIKKQIEKFDTNRYRNLSLILRSDRKRGYSTDTVKLLGGGTGIKRINSILKEWARKDVNRYISCLQLNIYVSSRLKIQFWNVHWISFNKTSDYCNDSDVYMDINYLTFDVHSGRKINLWTWIKNSSKKEYALIENDSDSLDYSSNYSASDELSKMILSKAQTNKGAGRCPENDVTGYHLSLNKKGMVFGMVPDLKGNCAEEVLIPYPDLLPFLTAEGKAAVKSIMAENEKK